MAKQLVVLASGNGSNLQAIFDACESGFLPAEVAAVVSDRKAAFALERARLHGAVDGLLVGAGTAHSGLPADEVRTIFEMDIELNAQGLAIWLARRAKRRE